MDAKARTEAVHNAYAGLNSLGTSGIFVLVPTLAEAESMRAWWTEHRCEKRGEGYKIQVLFPAQLKGASAWCVNCLGCGGHHLGHWDAKAAEAEAARLAEAAKKEGDAAGSAGAQRDVSLREHCQGGCASEELTLEDQLPRWRWPNGIELNHDVTKWHWISAPGKTTRCALGFTRHGLWVRFEAHMAASDDEEDHAEDHSVAYAGSRAEMVNGMAEEHYREYIADTYPVTE